MNGVFYMDVSFKKVVSFLGLMILCNSSSFALAKKLDRAATDPVEERAKQEEKIPPNYFAITLYKPTYILPFYYTGSPANAIYQNNAPANQRIKNAEFKYQFSLKVPLWKNINSSISSLFFSYTQRSYWQLYNHSPFFRESNYEPEIFLANEVNWVLHQNWKMNFLNAGVSHQSNGYGNSLQRGWNRFYLDAVNSVGDWMVGLRPWYIISSNDNNRDIGNYLGHGSITVAYQYKKNVFSIQAHNLVENINRATAEVTWSFPITPYIKGYVQLFSGYGQSLIEYNHRTNSAGIGIAFNDWI